MKATTHRFMVLDAWRGVAACLIVVMHFTALPGLRSHLHQFAFVTNSGVMVDFFFVLSGFVISYAACGKISDIGTATAFMIRRFGRLWPLHVTMLALLVAVSLSKWAVSRGAVPAFGPYNSVSSIIFNLLLIQSLGVQKWAMWNTPSWSISVEFYTYFIFVGMCLFTARNRLSTIWPAIILMLLSLLVLVRYGSMGSSIDLGIFRCIYGFFAGHLTFLVWLRRKSHSLGMEWIAIALAGMFILYGANETLLYFAPLVFAFAIWVFAGEKGLISRLGKSTAMQKLGAWSYSIYMMHWPAIHFINSLFPWADAQFGIHMVSYIYIKSLNPGAPDVAMPVLAMPNYWAGDAATLLFLAAIILISSVTYRYIESPARLFFNKLSLGNCVLSTRSSAV